MDVDHPVEQKETGRLEAFSDGVFAIAITLLILTIPPPPAGLLPHGAASPIPGYISDHLPFFLAYIVSFMTILVMWANHHGILNLIVRADRVFLILNGVLLMCITFVNYPTAVVAVAIANGDRNGEQFAALFYTGTLIVIAISYNLLWRYASHRKRLLDDHVSPQMVAKITREYRFGPLFYLATFIAAYFNVFASLGLALALAMYFGLTGQSNPVHPTAKQSDSPR